MTLCELLHRSEEVLARGPHPTRARLDAETLLLQAIGQSRSWLLGHTFDPVTPGVEDTLAPLLLRRLKGEPIQYILGQTEFYGLPFRVADGVLIPRPETEHLVEEALRVAANWPVPRILDIGTGSGAIAIALAHGLPQACVTTVDISPEALAIARENAVGNGVGERIRFLNGDLLQPVAGQEFELIVSNPPYVPLGDFETLAVEVREHEPHTALFAGVDGLDIYRRLIPSAREHLVPGGWLLLEIGYSQQAAVETLLEAAGYAEIRFLPDYQGIARVACAKQH
jgi:release factor glutamine methyltransferase